MAFLLIEQFGKRQAGSLSGRVLIGRWPDNTIVIDDRAVSRIHAWIGVQDGCYYIADAGSRTGTYVNGQPLRERHFLADGDHFQIGPAVLTYSDAPIVAEDPTEEIELTPRTPGDLSGKHGVFMDCVCGAPLWLPADFHGVGQCRYCGHTVTQGPPPAEPFLKQESPIEIPAPVPQIARNPPPIQPPLPAMKQAAPDDDDFEAVMNDAFAKPPTAAPQNRHIPPPAPAPRPTAQPGPVIPSVVQPRTKTPAIPPGAIPAASAPPTPQRSPRLNPEAEQVCGICHSPITVFDEVTECPSCGLEFHVDCWQENHGCSAYGCPQVGAAGKPE